MKNIGVHILNPRSVYSSARIDAARRFVRAIEKKEGKSE